LIGFGTGLLKGMKENEEEQREMGRRWGGERRRGTDGIVMRWK